MLPRLWADKDIVKKQTWHKKPKKRAAAKGKKNK